MDKRPIGVFDSGIGGLSVVKHLISELPHENIIYFGDIARIPYGTKSIAMIKHYTLETVNFLLSQNVKAIVIACNTISAVALDVVLNLAKGIPVINVISAGVKGVKNFNSIGIIATPATVNSNAYPLLIKKQNPKAKTYQVSCALLVPMVEEGFTKHPALKLVVKDYLTALQPKSIDSLILGCTHYPLIRDTITQVLANPEITIIDPALFAVHDLKAALVHNKTLTTKKNLATYKFYVTDMPLNFQLVGESFLGTPLNNLEVVSVE